MTPARGREPGAFCEAGDFAGFTPGNIALIQRGTCAFRIKADNAFEAGTSGVIIFNQGNVVPGMTARAGSAERWS